MKAKQFLPHRDDVFADTIILNGIRSLKLVMIERYKTSGLSGDEWRFRYQWQVQDKNKWKPLHDCGSSQDAAVAQFYMAFLTSHPEWHNEICYSQQFIWKGQPMIEMSDDNKPLPMLHSIGALQWSMAIAPEQALDVERDHARFCAQPGCSNEWTTLFKLKNRYRRDGSIVEIQEWTPNYVRGFCRKHTVRGDCGLEDSDENYEYIEGEPPNGASVEPDKISPSSFGGII